MAKPGKRSRSALSEDEGVRKILTGEDPLPQARKNKQPIVQAVIDEEDEILDPDPLRWALPANGMPAAKPSKMYTEVQLVHMKHIGHKVNWSLKEYHCDRTILTQICNNIGISRNQLRTWVFSKKRRVKGGRSDDAGPSSSSRGGSLEDEADGSGAAV